MTNINGSLHGRVALITGAARGIGRAAAVKLAEQGADIALLDIAQAVVPPHLVNPDEFAPATTGDMEETERLISALGRRVLVIYADVRDYQAMEAAAAQTVQTLGRLDILIASAGVAVWSSWADMSPEHWQLVIDVNLTGTFNAMKAATPYMIDQRFGRMITLSSIGGRQGVPGVANYAASKWAVIGLTKSVALALGEYNITVNSVAPTAVNTPMYRSLAQARSTNPDKPAPTAEDQDVQMFAAHALPIAALEPADIANGIAFLCSDEAKYISGVTLDIAAGANAHYTA